MQDVRATKWQSSRLGTMGEIDIPDGVHRYVPLWVTQIAVAVSCAVLAFATRGAVDALFSGAGPFALTIPFVLFATLFARWQAGVLTLCLSMLYAWYFVLPVQSSFAFVVGSDAPRVVVNITSGFAVVALAEMFRRTVRRAVEERDAQVRERQLYLEEFDHRVKNNFAMVASLIRMESRRPGITEDARQSLNAIHGRVASISRAHQALYRREGGVQEVAMQTYLGELCTSLEQALLEGRRIRLQTHIAPVAVPRQTGGGKPSVQGKIPRQEFSSSGQRLPARKPGGRRTGACRPAGGISGCPCPSCAFSGVGGRTIPFPWRRYPGAGSPGPAQARPLHRG